MSMEDRIFFGVSFGAFAILVICAVWVKLS